MQRFMPTFCLLLMTMLACTHALNAQVTPGAGGKAKEHGEQQIYAGYSYLSNDFRGSYFGNGGMNGWEGAYAVSLTKNISLKVSSFGYSKTVAGSPQHPIFILVGPQFTHRFHKESVFVQGLVGLAHLNSDWFYGAICCGTNTSGSNSFGAEAGGGLDTPVSRHFSWRVEGDFVYSNITVADNQIHGLPNYFGRASTGIVFRF